MTVLAASNAPAPSRLSQNGHASLAPVIWNL